jgi:hypothetical protein
LNISFPQLPSQLKGETLINTVRPHGLFATQPASVNHQKIFMRIYDKADINPMSWEEYGAAIQALLEKIQASGCLFDAIAPIMRSGAIPGSALAIQLRITKIIPLQFKYLHHPPRLESMMPLPVSFP